jgi:hypothetical protein
MMKGVETALSFRDGTSVAQRQGAKSWELRTTMSFAGLLAKQEGRAEARTILKSL